MSKINLLPWREQQREQKKKKFLAMMIFSAIFAVMGVLLGWSYFAYILDDQAQANQLIESSNQSLDVQLKNIEGLKEQRNAVIARMQLIQGLQGQRPITVRLVDELVRVTPPNLYFTKISRVEEHFSLEGKADNPQTVAELLRNLDASEWYRNAGMSSFVAVDEHKFKEVRTTVPRPEENYGSFVVTVDIGEIASVIMPKAKATKVAK
ncbi:PilN domain-containing protein [Acinetobacter pullicarnis]|uniref:PilN domain-containing protein n=1 Tax=Acinetobacter pullicarnis TaxID=2576829 RepID=UPI0011202431|nr:PilN domain-containing protein [Acinetobacter pullicarnis]